MVIILPRAINGINGIFRFPLIKIKISPVIQAKPMAAYQSQNPCTIPIIAEYQTSARPSFFFERKYAKRNIISPVTNPMADSKKWAYPEFIVFISIKKGSAKTNASRGTAPVLKS